MAKSWTPTSWQQFEAAQQPTWPDAGRFWQIVEKHRVNILYTAPTAIRMLMKAGDEIPKRYDLSTLRYTMSVGEPLNPEAVVWGQQAFGRPFHDNWWQTETGGIMISPLPGATTTKPGSATFALPGIVADIVDETGHSVGKGKGGILVIKRPWPSMIRTIWGDPERFKKSYYPEDFHGKYYLAGDGANRDLDGYFWIMGRIDDVINVSGHRIGTMEVESALVAHSCVSEAAVVGYPHDIKGQGIYAYVTLNAGLNPSEELRKELVAWVRKEIGPIATPDAIQWAPGLPKTRSGKIMRRILRKIAENDFSNLGDTSTLADPAVVDDLVKNRAK